MRNPSLQRVFLAALLSLCLALRGDALTISLQYPATPLFSAALDPVAKAAINAAASDLSAAVTTSLASITTDAYIGSSGGANVTLGFAFSYLNPVNNVQTTVSNATIAANIVTIPVGARSLFGNTLGVSSPGFVQLDISQFSGGGNPNGWLGAVSIAESKAEMAYKRGAGPVVGTAMGSASLGDVTANINVDFGITYGSLALDWDSNNDGAKDSDAQLSNYWHFDHTTPVASGKNDLYSVALHELIHSLGVGTSHTWNSHVSGTTWTGSEVLAITGSGANLINAAGDHAAAGLMSRRITDGMQQEVVIDPTITSGTRKLLTELDLAFLRDIGHSTITPSFNHPPGDFDNDGDVDGTDLQIWKNAYALNANGDADSDNDSDGRDFLLWQRNYTGALAITAVPEPHTNLLAVMLSSAALFYRRTMIR